MSGDSAADDRSVLEDNLKTQLLKGCCQVFHRQNGREITVLGCLAVTIKSQASNVSPLVYFVHVNQILTEQDYKTSAEKGATTVQSDGNAANNNGNNPTVHKDIKAEPETLLFSSLPSEMIPPGKGFVVKTQTVYEKTADGEERKVSVSTQGLIDTCDMKVFASQQQDASGFKQEPPDCQYQQQQDAYYEDCYDQGAYTGNGNSSGDYNRSYVDNNNSGEYYEGDYEALPPKRPKVQKRSTNKGRAGQNLTRRKAPAGFKNCYPNGLGDEQVDYQPHQQQHPHQQAKRGRVRQGFGRAPPGSKLGRATHDPSNPYVVTRSMHECGYPGCGKRFKWKQHLLRHQTEKHGRVPSKKLAFEKVLVRNPNYQRQAGNSYCMTVSAAEEEEEEDYYEGEEYGQNQQQYEEQEYYYE